MVDLGLAAKVRPCVVLSVPLEESDRSLVTVVPHTTALRQSRFEVAVPAKFLRPGAFDARVMRDVIRHQSVNADRLNELRDRLLRLQRRLTVKDGIGSTWSAKTEDGTTHRYIINGVKSFDELTDEIETMFVWVWSFKDHLKAHARGLGKSDRWIEAEASADPSLSVCADIANRLKHGELRESRH